MEDPEFITKMRIGYVASQLLAVAIYFFIMMKVGLSLTQGRC